ncbi:MAG: YggT family protein [Acidobacteria bacterium]|nr:YggT family protein [Acidobacteriota bacterium]MBI3265169.1 YggT family protein [Acidobacteriota bacterium]
MPELLRTLIDLYSFVVVVSVVVSWIGLSPSHPVSQVTSALVDPALAPIRRVLPAAGGLDFSPMVLLILLQALKSAIR